MSALPLHCPLCAGDFQVDSNWAGQQVSCPLCQGIVVVPSAAPPGPAPAPHDGQPIAAPRVRRDHSRKIKAQRRLRNNVIAFAICIIALFAILYFFAR